ncbi:hypothetical protein B188_07480 [Candidatus Brocadiaceae bacterium B188]|nr:carboxypeptidase regulatory-like domain-containing protein [Candidatus Brocadia sapporoensis]QQR67931.1 MAG: carboxypeptidase regulatory-like domain-containing protein [Candidatus Brocadia sp.]RZV58038.1 MAG: carboxypeptidase regulatory-like domain-containing protein [Candidatus Brocadia sp. BROELEC01]TWU52789.1 hypothetical protein B188_07480 [Candidatus Brocadiaceae bacterium B188]
MVLRNKLFLSSAIVFGLLAATNLTDSVSQAATIIGVVSDENGDPIEGALITATPKQNNGGNASKKKVYTDPEGAYEIEGIKKGKHKLTIESGGYEKATETLKITNKKEEVEKDFTLTFSIYSKTTNTESMDAAVASFKEIDTLRKTGTATGEVVVKAGNDIETTYEGDLRNLAKEVDEKNNLNLDDDILSAIDDYKTENQPALASQVIDKTLKRVFYLALLKRITDVYDNFHTAKISELKFLWDDAYAAYQALIALADKENKVITEDRLSIETGSYPNLEDQITVAFIRGQKALKRKKPDEDRITLGIQRQIIRISLVRAFYIGVLREAGGVLSNRDANPVRALVNQKEGEVYYRAIEAFISRDNPEGNETIKSQLTGDLADVDADSMVSELSKGFMGRVRGELESNATAINASNRDSAIITAEEALHYSKIFLEDLNIRLSTEDSEVLVDALNALRDASNMVDDTSAAAARLTISTILDGYESELP